MKVLISLLLLCVCFSGAALTIEEEYLLHSEGLVNNSNYYIEQFKGILYFLNEEAWAAYEEGELSESGYAYYGYRVMPILSQIIADWEAAVYTAQTQMDRLKVAYNRREE